MVTDNELFNRANTKPVWRDADTVIDPISGKPIRIQGVDTRETTKVNLDTGEYSSGQTGGQEAFDASVKLADLYGLNSVYDSGQTDATRVRNVGDLYNPCLLYTSPSPRDS